MSSIVDSIVDRYLDWRAFTGSGDPLLDVSKNPSVNEIRYGKPGRSRVKNFDEDGELIDFFNSRLKDNYHDPEDFVIGESQETREYVGNSRGGLGSIGDSWALDVPDSLRQLRSWIKRDANLEVGPYQPGVVMVNEDEKLEEAIERGLRAELEKANKYGDELEKEFANQTVEYLGAATVKAVSEAAVSGHGQTSADPQDDFPQKYILSEYEKIGRDLPEDTPSVEWYKEQLENKEELFNTI